MCILPTHFISGFLWWLLFWFLYGFSSLAYISVMWPPRGSLRGSLPCFTGNDYLREEVYQAWSRQGVPPEPHSGPCWSWTLCSQPETMGGIQSSRAPGQTDSALLGEVHGWLGEWFAAPLHILKSVFCFLFFKPSALKNPEEQLKHINLKNLGF